MYLRENTENIYLQLQQKKNLQEFYKNGEKISKIISYILQFIDRARFMRSSLSGFVNSPSEPIQRSKCKFVHDDKK